MIALSKIDLVGGESDEAFIRDVRETLPDDVPVLPISAVTGTGMNKLRYKLWDHVSERRKTEDWRTE